MFFRTPTTDQEVIDLGWTVLQEYLQGWAAFSKAMFRHMSEEDYVKVHEDLAILVPMLQDVEVLHCSASEDESARYLKLALAVQGMQGIILETFLGPTR